jgi:DNA-binding beta-propeller fold protein YncE
VVSGGWGTVQLGRSDTGTLLWSSDLGSLYVEALAFSPSEDRLAIAETNGRVAVLSRSDGAMLRTLPSIDAGHTGLAWDPLDRWVVVAGADGTLHRIEEATADEAPVIQLFDGPVTALALSSDGVLFAAGAGAPIMARDNWGEIIKQPPAEPELVLGRLADGAIVARCPLALGPSSICFSPDNGRVFVGGNDGSVLAFALPTATSEEIPTLALSPQLVVRCLPRTDLTADRAPATTPHMSWHQVSSLSCTADGSRLLVGQRNGAVNIVMPQEDGLLLTIQTDWSVHATALAQADDGLVVASRTPLMVLETALPSRQVAETRQLVAAARTRVDPIVASEHILDRVLKRIDEEVSDPAVRAEARRYATSRGEYQALMISQATELARDPAAGRAQHQAALDWIEHVEATRRAQRASGRSSFDLLRATLSLRVGRVDAAAELLERRLVAADGADPDLDVLALLAMTRLHQGRLDEAERLVAEIQVRIAAGELVAGEAIWWVPEATRAVERRRGESSGRP